MICLYELSHEKYYVEITTDPEASFQRHIDGVGGPVTQFNTPICIIETREFSTNEEMYNIINSYRMKYGSLNLIENVSYSK
jgi:predicted GIY-YIG superfamily endonuclease